MPSELVEMTDRERAFIYASIQVRIEQEKREANRLKTGRGRRRR
ncbi:MAG: hypothetical protein ACOX6E_08815 [Syntrophomonadaceae bacterium]